VRISSKTTYNKGLFIFDVKHSPYGCGTWPALWLVEFVIPLSTLFPKVVSRLTTV